MQSRRGVWNCTVCSSDGESDAVRIIANTPTELLYFTVQHVGGVSRLVDVIVQWRAISEQKSGDHDMHGRSNQYLLYLSYVQ